MSLSEKGHDSHYVYAILKKRVIKSALPNLGGKKKTGEFVFLAILIALAGFGGTMAGFQIEQVINPPLSVFGVCQPPAIITNGGCFIVSHYVDSSGNQQTSNTPSGTYYFPNGTGYTP